MIISEKMNQYNNICEVVYLQKPQRRMVFAGSKSYFLSLPNVVFVSTIRKWLGGFVFNGLTVYFVDQKFDNIYCLPFGNMSGGSVCLGSRLYKEVDIIHANLEDAVKAGINLFWSTKFQVRTGSNGFSPKKCENWHNKTKANPIWIPSCDSFNRTIVTSGIQQGSVYDPTSFSTELLNLLKEKS